MQREESPTHDSGSVPVSSAGSPPKTNGTEPICQAAVDSDSAAPAQLPGTLSVPATPVIAQLPRSPAHAEAVTLHAKGLNVFPIKPGKKTPFGSWDTLKRVRLQVNHLDQAMTYLQPELPHTPNIAVMCGATSRNLFVIDCDSRDAFHKVQCGLKKLGIETWTRSSHRGGHFWFLCSDGVVRNEVRDGLEVRGNDCYVMASGSTHPVTGELLDWSEQPGDLPYSVDLADLADLDFLNLRLLQPNRSPHGLAEKRGALPPVADKVLVQGDTTDYGGDNSRAEYAACLSLLGVGQSPDDVIALFRLSKPPHFKRIGEEAFRRSVLDKAYADQCNAGASSCVGQLNSGHWPGAHMSKRADYYTDHYDKYLLAIQSLDLPGTSGRTDKAVLGALCERQRLDKSVVFRASVRELAVLANVTALTVSRSLKRLIASGYILREEGPACGNTSHPTNHPRKYSNKCTRTLGHFRLVTEKLVQSIHQNRDQKMSVSDTVDRTVYPLVGDTVPLTDKELPANLANLGCNPRNVLLKGDISNDAWHRQGLGKSGLSVWRYLHLYPGRTVAEIATGINSARSTVYDALRKLETVGLVESDLYCAGGDSGHYEGGGTGTSAGVGKCGGRSERKLWFALDADEGQLREIACGLGTLGFTEARGKRFHEERRHNAGQVLLQQIDNWKRRTMKSTG